MLWSDYRWSIIKFSYTNMTYIFEIFIKFTIQLTSYIPNETHKTTTTTMRLLPHWSIYSHERAVRESQLASLAHRDQQPISEEPPITQLMMSNDRRIRVSWLLGNVSRKCGTLLTQRECLEVSKCILMCHFLAKL